MWEYFQGQYQGNTEFSKQLRNLNYRGEFHVSFNDVGVIEVK